MQVQDQVLHRYEYSKTKAVLMLIGGLFVAVIVGVWIIPMVLDGDYGRRAGKTIYAAIVGIPGGLALATYGLFLLMRLKHGLQITTQGIRSVTWGGKLIAWSRITQITLIQEEGENLIGVRVGDLEQFEGSLGFVDSFLLVKPDNEERYPSFVLVKTSMIKAKKDDVLGVMLNAFRSYSPYAHQAQAQQQAAVMQQGQPAQTRRPSQPQGVQAPRAPAGTPRPAAAKQQAKSPTAKTTQGKAVKLPQRRKPQQ